MKRFDGNAMGIVLGSSHESMIDWNYLKGKIDFVVIISGNHDVPGTAVASLIQGAYDANIPRILLWGTQPDWPAAEKAINLNSALALPVTENVEVMAMKKELSSKSFHAVAVQALATAGVNGKPMDKQWVCMMTKKFIEQVKAVFPDKKVLLYSNDDYVNNYGSEANKFSMFDWSFDHLGFPNGKYVNLFGADLVSVRGQFPDDVYCKPDGLNTAQAWKFWRWGVATVNLGKGSASVGLCMFNGKVMDMRKFLGISDAVVTPPVVTDPTTPETGASNTLLYTFLDYCAEKWRQLRG